MFIVVMFAAIGVGDYSILSKTPTEPAPKKAPIQTPSAKPLVPKPSPAGCGCRQTVEAPRPKGNGCCGSNNADTSQAQPTCGQGK